MLRPRLPLHKQLLRLPHKPPHKPLLTLPHKLLTLPHKPLQQREVPILIGVDMVEHVLHRRRVPFSYTPSNSSAVSA